MASNPSQNPPQPRDTAGSLRFVFWLALVYLVVLLALGVAYVTSSVTRLPFTIPDSLGPVPIGVPWFGALGAVLISLSGVFDHGHDWDPTMVYWHISRPLIGASLAIVSVLVFQAGILAVNSQPHPGGGFGNLLYYLIAFLVGYREETFRELIKRLGDVVIGPGGAPPAPVVRGVQPNAGPVGGGTPVTISGSGFRGATAVRFGQSQATFSVDSDGQITATSPPAGTPGAVSVSVTTKQGAGTGATFTYGGAP